MSYWKLFTLGGLKKVVELPPQPISVKKKKIPKKPKKMVKRLSAAESLLWKVVQKHEAHTALSCDREGEFHIQVHSKPNRHFWGTDLMKVFKDALK